MKNFTYPLNIYEFIRINSDITSIVLSVGQRLPTWAVETRVALRFECSSATTTNYKLTTNNLQR